MQIIHNCVSLSLVDVIGNLSRFFANENLPKVWKRFSTGMEIIVIHVSDKLWCISSYFKLDTIVMVVNYCELTIVN